MSSNDLITTVSQASAATRTITRDLLVDLGFEPVTVRWTDQQPGYRYNFGNLVLEASQVTGKYLQPEILFTGTMATPRVFGSVEFSLPLVLESYEQGVALIAYNIGQYFLPARECPWLMLGRKWEEHLPGRRELRLYEQRPQCHVESDWFKIAAKKLIAAGVAGTDETVFSLSFESGVLRFEVSGQIVAAPAIGTSWTQTYSCKSQGLAHLSKRTPSQGVSISVWEEYLTIGRLRLQLMPQAKPS